MKPRLYFYNGNWCLAFCLRVTEDPMRMCCASFRDACCAAKKLLSLRQEGVPA
jgi:hypothetical protein